MKTSILVVVILLGCATLLQIDNSVAATRLDIPPTTPNQPSKHTNVSWWTKLSAWFKPPWPWSYPWIGPVPWIRPLPPLPPIIPSPPQVVPVPPRPHTPAPAPAPTPKPHAPAPAPTPKAHDPPPAETPKPHAPAPAPTPSQQHYSYKKCSNDLSYLTMCEEKYVPHGFLAIIGKPEFKIDPNCCLTVEKVNNDCPEDFKHDYASGPLFYANLKRLCSIYHKPPNNHQ